MAKAEPAVMTLTFRVPVNSYNNIDTSLAVSLVNRRFYRQGLEWQIGGIDWQLHATDAGYGGVNGPVLTVSTIAHSWITSQAWKSGYRLWMKQQQQVLDEEPTIRPRWMDFKVFANPLHYTAYHQENAGLQNNWTPANFETLLPIQWQLVDNDQELIYPPEDWVYSQFVFPNSDAVVPSVESHIVVHGSDSYPTVVSLVEGYQKARAMPQSPDPVVLPTDTWYTDLFDLGENDEEIRANLKSDNDELPYDQDDYPYSDNNFPLGEIQDIIFRRNTIGLSEAFTPGFTAPCGLIEIQSLGFDGSASAGDCHFMQLHLVPGPHRGYMARPMQDV